MIESEPMKLGQMIARKTWKRGFSPYLSPELLYLDLLKRCLTRSIFAEETTYDPAIKQHVPFDRNSEQKGGIGPQRRRR